MPTVVKSAQAMIAGMSPTVQDGTYSFVSVATDAEARPLLDDALASFREDEGVSLILPLATARGAGLDVTHPMRCITLNVYSALDGFGLTAAVAGALADAEIPCNMVAAFHHDHAFVPVDLCDQALRILHDLQTEAVQTG